MTLFFSLFVEWTFHRYCDNQKTQYRISAQSNSRSLIFKSAFLPAFQSWKKERGRSSLPATGTRVPFCGPLRLFAKDFSYEHSLKACRVFSSKIIRHIMCMIKTCIIKIQSRNLIHYHRLLTMIPKNKNPWQNHPIKNNPDSGSNILSLNRDRDRLQKYWANEDRCCL